MQVIEFNGKEYRFPGGIADVTVRSLILFQEQVESTMPKSMQAIRNAHKDDRQALIDALEPAEISTAWPAYYARVVSFFTGIPHSEMARMDMEDVLHLHRAIETMLTSFEPNPDARSFEWKDERGQQATFYYPNKLMKGHTLGEFIEAAQYEHKFHQMQQGDFAALPYIIAILCRKEGEPFTEGLDELRAPVFMGLPLSIARQCAFFFLTQSVRYLQSSLHSGPKAQQAGRVKVYPMPTDGTASLRTSGRAEPSPSTAAG